MKAIAFVAAAATALIATSAFAADLPAPPAPDQVMTSGWDGFYIGVNAGAGTSHRTGSSTIIGFPAGTWDYNLTGGMIGAQAGFNYALTDNFVVGVEVSGDAANITGNDQTAANIGGGNGTYNWLAMATAKVGYATDKFMVYVDGGYSLANFNFNGSLGCNFSETDSGPTVGVGAAVKLTDNVSADLSYNHVWYGGVTSSCSTFGAPVTVTNNPPTADIVKLGVNYRF